MTERDELIATAEIGDAALKFSESELGQCLLGIADQEVLAAQIELVDVDPEDFRKIREIQNKAKVALMFKGWLLELIDKGNAALEVYRNEQEK